ncbi:MAG: hypothetical protein U1E70_08205 [Acetobacteraceae bacterium]|nr:hypothetical protein [Pseudomonadota bacterium]
MSLLSNIDPVMRNALVDQLVPMLQDTAGNDPDAARTMALELLAEYQPRNLAELLTACRAVALKLMQVKLELEALEPALSPAERREFAKVIGQLDRTGRDTRSSLRRSQRHRTAAQPRPKKRDSRPQS